MCPYSTQLQRHRISNRVESFFYLTRTDKERYKPISRHYMLPKRRIFSECNVTLVYSVTICSWIIKHYKPLKDSIIAQIVISVSKMRKSDKIGILHEGAERRSVLHEAGQTWWTNPKGEFTRFDHAECNTLLCSRCLLKLNLYS